MPWNTQYNSFQGRIQGLLQHFQYNIIFSPWDLQINDLDLLLDICLREIQSEKDASVRIQILKMIETIMDHEMYKMHPYKLDDIRDTVNELILFEDDQFPYSVKEKESIAKLNLKFQILNFWEYL